MIAAIIGSRYVVYLVAAIALAGGIKLWKMNVFSQGKAAGTAEVIEKVKEKADSNAESRRKITDAVAKGKRGPDDPNRLRAP